MTAAGPSGVVTFLFTDVEGSTRRWEADADGMRAAFAAHDEVLRLPHFETLIRPEPIRPARDLHFHRNRVTAQHLTGCVFHRLSGHPHRLVNVGSRRFDKHRVMDRTAHPHTTFRRQTASEPEHFGCSGLHREVADRRHFGVVHELTPAVYGVQPMPAACLGDHLKR